MKLLGATLFLLSMPAMAFADDQRMRVMEVQLGGTVHADSQFVELADPGETFSETYNLVVYDASGKSIGAQSLPLSRGTTRVMLVNSSAQDEYKLKPGTDDTITIVNLQTVLPASGSVCFRRQDGGQPPSAAADQAGTRIHCMGWGNASAFPVSIGGTEHAAAPPAGTSLQKLSGCLQVDPPTPNAPSKQACELRVDKPIAPVEAAPVDAAPIEEVIDAAPVADAAPKADASVKADGQPNSDRDYSVPASSTTKVPKTKGCNAGGDVGWLGVVGVALAMGARRKRRSYAIANL